MIVIARRLVAVTLVAFMLAGCGYSFRGSGLPDRIKTVAVPIFRNRTQVPAVENGITSAVVDAFANNGRLKVVPAGQADSILDGEIVGYSIEPLSFDQRINAREYRLRVVLNIQFRDVRNNAMLWREEGLSEVSDFRVVGQVSDTISREEGAVRQAAVEIGRKVVIQVVGRF